MRVIALGICGLLAIGATAGAAERTENVYERMAARAREPGFEARMAESARRIEEFVWLLGDWNVTITVFANGTGPENTSQDKATFRKFGDSLIADDKLTMIVGYDAFAGRWVFAGFELPAVPFMHDYADWDGKRTRIEIPARIAGEDFRLRQTFTRIGPDEFELFNEQRLADGQFHAVDRYVYRRAQR